MSDFLEHSLKQDDWWIEKWGFDKIHLFKATEDKWICRWPCALLTWDKKTFVSGRIKCPFGKDGCVLSPETGRDAPSHSLQSCIPQETSSRRYRSRRTTSTTLQSHEAKSSGFIPLITFPRAVFLKNLRWVTTASVLVRFNIVISTMILIQDEMGWRQQEKSVGKRPGSLLFGLSP